MASGITGDASCVNEFEKFKLQNSGSKEARRAYLIFRIVGEKIVLTKAGGPDDSYDQFLSELTSDPKDGAYGLFDFKASTPDGRILQKIVFIAWAPDTGLPVKQKMMYASAREPFKQQLGSGLAYVIQATDHADIDFEVVNNMVIKGR